MKTSAAIDRALEQRILTALCIPKSFGAIAQETALSFRAVEEIATRHGFPNGETMQAALDAMIAEGEQVSTVGASKGTTAGGRELQTVPVDDLRPDPDNPRDDLGELDDLAESIESAGLLQPIIARKRAGQLIIVAGHRRHAAVKKLGWTHIDVVVTRDMRPDEILAAMIIENGQRRDLDPIEQARAFARIKQLEGINSRELARRIGRSQPFVDDRLRLLDLPPEDQERVRRGEMGTTHGTAKARVLGGNVRSGGGRIPHLGAEHTLAGKARARCTKLHNLKTILVGKTACGDCWESVIRADERHKLAEAAIGSTCSTCGHVDSAQAGDGDAA